MVETVFLECAQSVDHHGFGEIVAPVRERPVC